MQEHGIDLHAAQPENAGLPEFKEASEACKQYLPNDGELPKLTAEQAETGRAYTKCMRTNGVPNFPDPVAPGPAAQAELPKFDPAHLEKATAVCQASRVGGT